MRATKEALRSLKKAAVRMTTPVKKKKKLPPGITPVRGMEFKWNGLAAFPDPALREIADVVHARTCGYSHTDQCGWFYDTWARFEFSQYQDRKACYDLASKAARALDRPRLHPAQPLNGAQTIMRVLRAVGFK